MKQFQYMKRFYKRHADILQIVLVLLLWRVYLFILQSISYLYPARIGYLGFIPEANFDGVFYINISEYWYRGLDQAFFPLYPILMKLFTYSTSIPPAASGLIVSLIALTVLLFSFRKLMQYDGLGKYSLWGVLFLLFFPTSFFLSAVYTESLFLAFVVLSFYFTRKNNLKVAVLFAILATATRIVGIFLLPALLLEVYMQLREKKKKISIMTFIHKSWILLLAPLGLLGYMGFLWYKYADPLLFVHIQPLFGAGRSGGEIIFLPQVLYRYFKILTSVSYSSQVFLISIFELFTLFFATLILLLALKKGVRKSYIFFSICVLFFPTFSGTLSSIPRYALMCFAMYIFMGSIKNVYLKSLLLLFGFILEAIFVILFLRGYFVS